MPIHVFTVVSRGVSVDAQTNALSMFSVLEQVRTPHVPVAVTDLTVVTLWLRNDPADEGQEFTHRLRIMGPDGNQVAGSTRTFQFDKPRHRMITRIGIAPFGLAGEYRFEVSMKRANDPDFPSASAVYPLHVVVTPQEDQERLFETGAEEPA